MGPIVLWKRRAKGNERTGEHTNRESVKIVAKEIHFVEMPTQSNERPTRPKRTQQNEQVYLPGNKVCVTDFHARVIVCMYVKM